MVPVERAGLSVEVGAVLIRVQDLDFIPALKIDPAVSPPLTLSLDFVGCRSFDMKLDIPEAFLGSNVSTTIDGDGAIVDDPFCRAALDAFPLLEMTAIEEHNGIGRCLSGLAAGLDDGRLRVVGVGCAVQG